jgi:hypothetical protein
LLIKTKIASYHTADSKPVKQEVNGTVILPPLVFPLKAIAYFIELIMLLALPTNVRPGRKGLPGTNALAYLPREKSFKRFRLAYSTHQELKQSQNGPTY